MMNMITKVTSKCMLNISYSTADDVKISRCCIITKLLVKCVEAIRMREEMGPTDLRLSILHHFWLYS